MYKNLYQKEFLDLETICCLWSKESNLSSQEIADGFWAEFWRGGFINENRESMLHVPYRYRVFHIPVIDENSSWENINEIDTSSDVAIRIVIAKDENNNITDAYPVVKDDFYHPPIFFCPFFLEPLKSEFVEYMKEYIKKECANNNVVPDTIIMDEENEFIQHIRHVNPFIERTELIQKTFLLERSMVFFLIQKNQNLPYRPKNFIKRSQDASDKDYQKFAEHKINPKDYIDSPSVEYIKNPLIKPVDLFYVLRRDNETIPEFLSLLIKSSNYKEDPLEKSSYSSTSKTLRENNKIAAQKRHEPNNAVKAKFLQEYEILLEREKNISNIDAARLLLNTGKFKIMKKGVGVIPGLRRACTWIGDYHKAKK